MVRVNLADAGEGFEPLPRGTYALRIDDGELGTAESEEAKHPGSQYVNWDMIVTQGDNEGRHVFANTIVSHGECECDDEETFNKGLFAIAGLLRASGRYSDEELDSDEFELDIDDLIGSEVAAVLGIRKSEVYGDSNNVKRFKPISALAGTTSDSLLP